jgi:ion channel-forming bestrophin family protein
VEGASMRNHLTNRPENTVFFKTALRIHGSATPKVIKLVMFFMFYAGMVSFLGHHYPQIGFPIGPFEYGGLIMGLILVFRINAGYDRWWEARKLWGTIVNQSRNLNIILMQYTKGEKQEWKKIMQQYLIAWPILMKVVLRGTLDIDAIKHLFSMDQLRILSQAKNPANLLSMWIAQHIQQGREMHIVDDFTFLRADEQREQMTNAQGACERILKTPMPLVMAIKSRRFILLFLLVLPFALINISVYITPWILFLVSYALLSLDQISIELQNPFSVKHLSHLPLDEICHSIEKNIIEMNEIHIE